MFKIGEFSKLTQVSIRMLRYYDETGLLKPIAIYPFTHYRKYSAEQITTLNKIIFLRDLGFNVSDIALALNQWSDEFIINQLNHKQSEILNTIKHEQNKLAKIELAKRDIKQEKMTMHYNVAIKAIPSYPVLSLRRVVPDYYAEGLLWREMLDFIKKNNLATPTNSFTIYHDMDYREKDIDIEICVSVEQLRENTDDFTYRNTEAVSIMAYTMVYGAFENIANAFTSFANWLETHNQYKMAGKNRQIVHRGPWNEKTPNHYLTEIQIPLKKIKSN